MVTVDGAVSVGLVCVTPLSSDRLHRKPISHLPSLKLTGSFSLGRNPEAKQGGSFVKFSETQPEVKQAV